MTVAGAGEGVAPMLVTKTQSGGVNPFATEGFGLKGLGKGLGGVESLEPVLYFGSR